MRAGDLLAELDNTALQLELAQAERNLREMTSPAAVAAALRKRLPTPARNWKMPRRKQKA